MTPAGLGSRSPAEPPSAGIDPDRAGQVVATAGHVDHGKSALIRALTGMEPDRLEEEQRRGLTIDLGYAWCVLPSGREVGFVDVPGHERFVKNMLAGVGPVRLVLFIVAADEGWKRQSEEHLEILDVLGIEGAVIALTKSDLVDAATLAAREEEIRERVDGTALASAPIVASSAATGAGVDRVAAALDTMLAEAPTPADDGRPRLFVDRAFTIRGAGTVVTGTLTGGPLRSGDHVELSPSGVQGRARGLQTHERAVPIAQPVSRVAVNLAGVDTDRVTRGDVLGLPGQWRPTTVIEGTLRTVRSVDRPLAARGAYKIHAGAAERDARLRFLTDPPGPAADGLVRITVSAPLTLDVGDRFVLRESGRRQTVAGGQVLDPHPPARPKEAAARLEARLGAPRAMLPSLLVAERGAVRAADVGPLTGEWTDGVSGATRVGPWWVRDVLLAELEGSVAGELASHHSRNPLSAGLPDETIRRSVAALLERRGVDRAPATDIVEHLASTGRVGRDGTVVRLPDHRVQLGEREDEARTAEQALRDGWPTPPTARELGLDGELVAAMETTGRLVAVTEDVVLLPEHLARAEAVVRELAARPEGMTASAFRARLGTTRKYAIPLLERFDRDGVTRREGDLRHLRSPSPERR